MPQPGLWEIFYGPRETDKVFGETLNRVQSNLLFVSSTLFNADQTPTAFMINTSKVSALNTVDISKPIDHLKRNKIETRNFFGQITDEPSVFGWMPAASIYFHDVNGHLLEFIAKLDEEPAANVSTISLSE